IGLVVPVPTLNISVATVVFGRVRVGTSASKTLTLTSTGTASVVISGATLLGAGFSTSGMNFPISLNPGQATTLTVEFSPSSVGSQKGQLTIASNSSARSSALVNLSGSGIAQPRALSDLSCGSGAITGSGADGCTVSLTSSAPNGGVIVNLSSSSSAVAVPSTVQIPAGASSAQFTAVVSSVTTAQPVTMTASAGGLVKSFTLQLNAAIPTLSINATSLAFGNVQVGTPATQALTLTGGGTVPITISGATIAGSGFALPGAVFPATLNPGQTANLNVQFDPTTAGTAAGQ